jgi:uncharacterized protein (DUF302 family)
MKYYFSKIVNGDFDSTTQKALDSLKEKGFGVVSEINMDKKFKEKLGVDFKRYSIYGVCNPSFAHKAVQIDDKLGILLPCNVIVIDQGENKTEVAAVHALSMMKTVGIEELEKIAAEVNVSLKNAIEEL